jgi:hypothetical protein
MVFVVPTLSFRLLYGLLILRHGRRQILWLGVTANPSAEWMARQLTEACGWEWTPKYIVRDRDSVYGEILTRRLRAMGIRDRRTASHSPWQNGHTERRDVELRLVVRGLIAWKNNRQSHSVKLGYIKSLILKIFSWRLSGASPIILVEPLTPMGGKGKCFAIGFHHSGMPQVAI